MKRYRLKISGLVQGVFYRVNAQKKAQELGLMGWVRNLPDGGVKAVAEGPLASLNMFVEWCRTGPPSSSVENVEVIEEEPTGKYQGFGVRY